jgi:recombination protein RecA
MSSVSFLNDFNKALENMDGISTSSAPPRYWYSTGNYVLNKIISGSYLRGIPQGRITTFAGPSSSGKSFLTGNVVKAAQQSGAYVLIVDSENAVDDGFMAAIGVDVNNNYSYVSVTTISQAQKVISSFLKNYKKEYGTDINAPQVLICIDSLSMLLTDTELENYEKGVQKGDQGQRNKQLKAMLRAFVQDIKQLNVAMVTTTQVYKNQDVLNGEGVWIIPDAVKYSASQIVLLTKLKLRDTGSKDIEGIRMKCEGYKTRFTKPFQTVTIEVPYETGIDPYNGLLDVAKSIGVVSQAGAWYKFGDEKFQSKNFLQYAAEVLKMCENENQVFLESLFDEDNVDTTDNVSASSKRKKKVTAQSLDGSDGE